MTTLYFLLTMSPLNLTLRSQDKGNDHQLKKPFIIEQIPPCLENSMENIHTDVGV